MRTQMDRMNSPVCADQSARPSRAVRWWIHGTLHVHKQTFRPESGISRNTRITRRDSCWKRSPAPAPPPLVRFIRIPTGIVRRAASGIRFLFGSECMCIYIIYFFFCAPIHDLTGTLHWFDVNCAIVLVSDMRMLADVGPSLATAKFNWKLIKLCIRQDRWGQTCY